MSLEPCPFCGGEAEHAFDYVRGGDGNKYHHVVCKSDRNHIGGVGCYNAAPGRNGNSGKCDHCYKKTIECVFAARAWNTRAPDSRIAALEAEVARKDEALRKVMPIRVEDGPDYASVYFGDGSTHSTQAMTMNPQDWIDISSALEALND